MDPWHVAHLMFLSAWGGVVVVELLFEARALDEASQRLAARVHHAIDLAVELPLLVGILVTGAWLTARAWPLTPLHWVKIAAGLTAIAANLICVVFVVQRQRDNSDPAALAHHSRNILFTGAGIPFGLVALYLGLAYFRA